MKTYLVALDTSPVAADVLAAVKELAPKTEARVILLRAVMRPLELPPEAYSMYPEKLEEMLVDAGKKSLEALALELPQDMVIEAVVQVGIPWQVICEMAKARNVDLIVLGAHGHSFLDRLIGTTTQRVLNHIDRSVLVVWPTLPGKK